MVDILLLGFLGQSSIHPKPTQSKPNILSLVSLKPHYTLFPLSLSLTTSKMATSRSRPSLHTLSKTLRSFCTKTHHPKNNHQQTHEFVGPNSFLGSWEKPKDPKDAAKKVAQLRREYGKQVKEIRKEYIHEVQMMRLEKQRKDEAKREALRVANEERKKLKAEAAKVRAEERKVAEEEFRQLLLKERAEKLENWRMKENTREEKKKEKNELLRRQSSMWIEEGKLERQILDVIVDTTGL